MQTPPAVDIEMLFVRTSFSLITNETAADGKDGQEIRTVRNYAEVASRQNKKKNFRSEREKERKKILTGKWISPFINKQETNESQSECLHIFLSFWHAGTWN